MPLLVPDNEGTVVPALEELLASAPLCLPHVLTSS